MDRRVTLFFPPAVLLTTLSFATVLALGRFGAASEPAALQQSNGDEFAVGSGLDPPTRSTVL